MKKIAWLAALALVAVSACKKKDEAKPADNTPPAPAPAAKMAEQPKPEPVKTKTGKDLADQYIACSDLINTGKLDDFAKTCVDASFVSHMDGMPDMKADDLKQHFADMRAAFPDMKHTPQLVLVNGRTIFAVNLVTGTQDGTLKLPGMPDVPATHKKIGFLMAHKLTINDENKATEEWAFFDPGTMMGQLGLLPKDAPAKRAAMDKGWDGAPNIVVAADDAKEKANVEGVQKGNEAFSAHKAADLEKWVTDDFVESDQTQEKDSTGKKDMEKNLKELFTAFSDIKATADVWGAGDYVVSLGTLEGTNDHDVGKMKKTGKHVSVKYVEVFQLKDGKASHLWRFMNSLEFAKQLGLMPAPGEAPKGEAPKGDAKDAKKPDAKKPAKK